ncbi:MAG: hypothetical protein LQ343_006344 [Gyalolechia ehrenbergii]|nr:MAG: hypothetical protein LQ343_006344 [Gyalolechia ehrenbergii]
MPAMLDDPTAPVIYRTSGAPPYPTPSDPQIPLSITPRQVTLRDRITIASLIPFSNPNDVPHSLLNYLCSQLNLEIEKGDTYPMISPMPLSTFGPYWFQNFAAIMVLGEVHSVEDVQNLESNGVDWGQVCLGSFYVKPNYPGRSSHVCNGGFLVTEAARNRGVGRLMGEGYLEWAPKLGYTYSVFNLVYETNVASCRIWDALGFKRVGRIKACGNLRSYPEELVDAIIYGRDLGPEGEDFVSEERFDKIHYYLKHGKYPNGADRAEKSRLRSAATHYKLLPAEDGSDSGERLMLKDKEVVSDPQRQYQIARQVHASQHGGINKTTATIAEKYHWVRIKETVSLVIKNCPDCKESIRQTPSSRSFNENQQPSATGATQPGSRRDNDNTNNNHNSNRTQDPTSMIERLVDFTDVQSPPSNIHDTLSLQPPNSHHDITNLHHHLPSSPSPYDNLPLDPQIMHTSHHHHHHQPHQPHHQPEEHEIYFEDQLRRAAAGIEDPHFGLSISGSHDPDTGLATGRHVREHDEPMAFVHEAGEDGGYGLGKKDGMSEELVDFDGRGV